LQAPAVASSYRCKFLRCKFLRCKFLPLQVSAVILNAVKDPEEFNSPQPLGPFNPNLIRRCKFLVPRSVDYSRNARELSSFHPEQILIDSLAHYSGGPTVTTK
jgi:hypothetical protein